MDDDRQRDDPADSSTGMECFSNRNAIEQAVNAEARGAKQSSLRCVRLLRIVRVDAVVRDLLEEVEGQKPHAAGKEQLVILKGRP